MASKKTDTHKQAKKGDQIGNELSLQSHDDDSPSIPLHDHLCFYYQA